MQPLFAESCLMWAYFSQFLIAANIGIMLFFTLAVAPTIFTARPPQWSAHYVRKSFPKYFLFNSFWLTPRINKARDDNQATTLKNLHSLSVGFNMLKLHVFVWLVLPQGVSV